MQNWGQAGNQLANGEDYDQDAVKNEAIKARAASR